MRHTFPRISITAPKKNERKRDCFTVYVESVPCLIIKGSVSKRSCRFFCTFERRKGFLLSSGVKVGASPTSPGYFLLPRHHGRTSSVGRALDCRAGGRGFDSRGRTNTQGLKITEK